MLDRWTEYNKCANKPINHLIELNMGAFNNWMSNLKTLNECINAKNPADLINAHNKLINDTNTEVVKYIQETNKIWFESCSEISKLFNDDLRNSISKASDFAKKGFETNKSK